MKAYIKPEINVNELRLEERIAACWVWNPDNLIPGFPREGPAMNSIPADNECWGYYDDNSSGS